MKKSLFILGISSLFSLGMNAQSNAASFTSSIEQVHQKEAFFKKKGLTYDIDIKFGGQPYLNGKVTQTTGGDKIKIEKSDGSTILYDGTNVVASGIDKEKLGGARFDIFTWPYFTGFPYKLNDPGTQWSEFGKKAWGNHQLNTAKLTFVSGTGDAPDDWYVVYQNPTTKILEGAAYIVSFGKGKEAAEKEPHAVKYSNFISVDGIPIPTKWTYHMWTPEKGYGQQIGEATLNNVLFLETADFSKPQNALEVVAP